MIREQMESVPKHPVQGEGGSGRQFTTFEIL